MYNSQLSKPTKLNFTGPHNALEYRGSKNKPAAELCAAFAVTQPLASVALGQLPRKVKKK